MRTLPERGEPAPTDKATTPPGRQAAIPVNQFRQIYHWPLSVKNPGESDEWFSKLSNNGLDPWQLVSTGLRCEDYEEAVYFHDFVSDFLYSQDVASSAHKPPKHKRFQRKDISQIKFTIPHGDHGEIKKEHIFDIARLEFDIFDFGVVIMTLEIVATGPGTLPEVQTQIDFIRRAFPGFWFKNGKPGLSPHAATLIYEGGRKKVFAPLTESESRKRFVENKGRPEIFPWWQEILAPLSLSTAEHTKSEELSLRHVLDERLTAMSYVSLTDSTKDDVAALCRISEGDWYRLAGADAAGTDNMPYNTEFLALNIKPLFYDRFFPCENSTNTTRQAFVGYHHLMAGTGETFDDHIQKHFSNHYRRLNFIAHMEFAAMITFSRRITELVKRYDDNARDFRNGLQKIQQDYLNFIHRYHFSDVSNHLQAKEMNALLRKTLGLDALRNDVERELSSAISFANTTEQTDIARSQAQLTEFATAFLPATLAAGFGGMNFLAGLNDGQANVTMMAIAQFFFWCMLAYGGASWLVSNPVEKGYKISRGIGCRLKGISIASAILAALFWMLGGGNVQGLRQFFVGMAGSG